MAQNWKAVAKHTGMTVAEVGVITGGIIVTKKFLDARVLFAKQIEKDPAIAERWYVKHQGAVKLVGGALAASFIKNPWLKMLCIGIAVEGAITEARVLTSNKDGVSFFEQVGASEAEIDQEMIEAAKSVNGFGDRFETSVAGFGDRFETSVAGWKDDTDLQQGTSMVAGW